MPKRRVSRADLAFALPILTLALFYLFVVIVRLVLGHWPSYGNPDPGHLPFFLGIMDVAVTLLLLAICLGPIVAVPTLIASAHPRLRRMLDPSIAFLVGWSISAIVVYADPGGFFDWLLD